MKMGYILISLGIVLVIAGAISLYQTKNKSGVAEQPTATTHIISPSVQPSMPIKPAEGDFDTPQTAPNAQVETSATKADKEDENERKGREFEEFVVRHFDKNYFTIKEWRSDKGVDGRFAEDNMNPDLVMTLHLNKGNYDVAIECKWRSALFQGKADVSYPEQLDRYRKYAKQSKIPVFMVIGIGGKPSNPETIYCMPLDKVKSGSISHDDLKPFYHKPDNDFYYDSRAKVLR